MGYLILIFALVFILYYSIYLAISKPRRDLLKRLDIYTKNHQRDLRDPEPITASERNLRLSLKDISKLFSRVERLKNVRGHFDRKLMKSGVLLRGEEFMVVMIASAIVFGALMGGLLQSSVGLILGVILGLLLPNLYLNTRQKKRQKQFDEQLGEVLTTMSNALRAGHSLMKALEVVARDSPEPAAEEFNYLVKELQLGIATETALKNMSERSDSRDLELVITAILIQRQVGGNLAQVLDNIADTIRDRMRIEGEIRTLTAQGKMSGVIIGILPIGLAAFFTWMNPDYIMELFTEPLGLIMVTLAVFSQILGVLVIRKIVQVNV